jgi:hypothetical protein
MSKDNDRPRRTWGDDDEPAETPGSFRDAYLNTTNQNRSRPRSGDTPQDDASETPSRSGGRARPRGGPGGGRIYEEGDERPTRPRPARQSREEVYSRLRQRPRQPIYSRNQDEVGSQPPARTKKIDAPRQQQARDYPRQRPASRQAQDNDHPYQQPVPTRRQPNSDRGAPASPGYRKNEPYNDYEEYDEYEVLQRRQRQPVQPVPQRRNKRGLGGRILSNILIGCLGGIITLAVVIGVVVFLLLHNTSLGTGLGLGKSTYTRQGSQSLSLGNATQLIIKNQVGNISVSIDQNASDATLASTKKVLASSSDEAKNLFNQITLTTKQISRGSDPACTASACLLITANVPTTTGGNLLGAGNGNTIDLTITLPASFNSLGQGATPNSINASTSSGNLSVSKFNGLLDLSGSTGNVNINVTGSLLFAGTCLQTTHGDINVGQGSIFDLNQSSTIVPCTNTTSSSDHPWFNIESGTGNVSLTLTALSTNLLLDANTNNGKITDGFGLNIPSASDGSATYHGPLILNTSPTASLYLSTSTGNITIQKQ